MKKPTPRQARAVPARVTELSDLQLARFLGQLAELYGSPQYGNPAVAASLRRLSSEIRSRVPKTEDRYDPSPLRDLPFPHRSELRNLSLKGVELFLADRGKNKNELLELAALRFSMPTSQLKRMNIGVVREAIRSALLHESSIRILSEEASREGGKRQS